MIKVIGDVHGKTKTYQKLLSGLTDGQKTIQVGDMGLGFAGVELPSLPVQHSFFRGNHDAPAICKAHLNYMGDWGMNAVDNFFWLAGAYSIDRAWRTEGVSWWADEQLSFAELEKALDKYKAVMPEYVVSHEAPSRAARFLLSKQIGPYFAAKQGCCDSRTAQAMQAMFEIFEPKEWVFGHYHVSDSFYLGRTKFTCVPELGVYDLETGAKNED